MISSPDDAIVGSIVWPRTSVNHVPILVSVAVISDVRDFKILKYVCVDVAVGITVAPPILEPPK